MDRGSKAEALRRAMQPEMPMEAPPEPSVWQRLMALFTTQGVPWADNANALLPESLSARQAVLRKRQQYQQLEDIAKGQ